ncbi:transposase [Microcoleus sp. F10-C6]|uniref:transposase n=1 Tax=unclassified Microcoleus TaxID=2642155 RepID=UPI002FD23ACE
MYVTNLTVKKGQNKIKEWLNHAQVFFRESASTIENHFEGICNYFLERTTSGVIEGINNRIKLIAITALIGTYPAHKIHFF